MIESLSRPTIRQQPRLGQRRQVAPAQPSAGAQRLGRLFWHVEVAPRPVVPVLKTGRPGE
jgi:hypothetical protein